MATDELARVTGGLLTESTVDDRVRTVETFTSARSIRRARALLKRTTPYRELVRSQPRSPEDCEMYKRLIRELGAIIAGHRPDRIRVHIRSAKKSVDGKECPKDDRVPGGSGGERP